MAHAFLVYPGGSSKAGGMSQESGGWLDEGGANLLRSLGIQPGYRVLDFGCGRGTYVLPLAQVVGAEGKVIAVDVDGATLRSVREKLDAVHDSNTVEVRQVDEDSSLEWISTRSLDAALLFDVLQHVGNWEGLFSSLFRVLKPGGLLIVNPTVMSHPGRVDLPKLESSLQYHGFRLRETKMTRAMHYDRLRDERILIFQAPCELDRAAEKE